MTFFDRVTIVGPKKEEHMKNLVPPRLFLYLGSFLQPVVFEKSCRGRDVGVDTKSRTPHRGPSTASVDMSRRRDITTSHLIRTDGNVRLRIGVIVFSIVLLRPFPLVRWFVCQEITPFDEEIKDTVSLCLRVRYWKRVR